MKRSRSLPLAGQTHLKAAFRPLPGRPRREGAGLVETSIAILFVGLLLALVMGIMRQTRRNEARLDDVIRRVSSLAFLRERIGWDLARSSSPELWGLREEPTEEGAAFRLLVSHDGVQPPAVLSVTYRFDPRRGVLCRCDRPLPVGRLTRARFALSRSAPRVLELLLSGPEVGDGVSLKFRLPAALRMPSPWIVDPGHLPRVVGSAHDHERSTL
ncbi:MAG: hypothetical protein HY815_10170 [Candidatus Riflebacteria bacterium]|nr:hypothetical protein [Candidatus Riflebacteria bacterium]